MGAEFYKIYNEVLSKSLKKPVVEDNTCASVGIGPQGDYAPGDARRPKAMLKGKMFERPKINGIETPKEG